MTIERAFRNRSKWVSSVAIRTPVSFADTAMKQSPRPTVVPWRRSVKESRPALLHNSTFSGRKGKVWGKSSRIASSFLVLAPCISSARIRPVQQTCSESISSLTISWNGSCLRKNSIQTEVSTSTLSKAVVPVAELLGRGGKFHFAGHGLYAGRLAQPNFVLDGGHHCLGLAPGLQQRHQLDYQIIRQGSLPHHCLYL